MWQYNGGDRLSNGRCDSAWIGCGGHEPSFVFCLRGSPTSCDSDTDNCLLGCYTFGRIGNGHATFDTPHLR